MSFCTKCGAQLDPDSKFCPSCGAPTEEAPDTTRAAEKNSADNEKWFGVLAYLGPLVFIPMFTQKDSEFVMFHVRQGFNLFVFYVALVLARYTLGYIPYVGTYFLRYVFDLGMLCIGIFSIIGIVYSLQHEMKPLPLIGDKFDLLKTLFKM